MIEFYSKPWWLLPVVGILVVVVAYLYGENQGWMHRIQYEVIQCADYGRCFGK